MAATIALGRGILLKKAAVTIAGLRVTSLSIDSTPIDITAAEDVGIQKLMAASAFRAMTFTASGVESDGILYTIAMTTATSQLLTDCTITIPSADATKDVITGDWYMSNYKLDGDYKDAIQFSATFTSSGTWTLT